jgi:hypothetical protein
MEKKSAKCGGKKAAKYEGKRPLNKEKKSAKYGGKRPPNINIKRGKKLKN